MQGKLFFIEILSFSYVGYGNDRFFPHTSPYIRMLRNNADIRRCSCFELALPVVEEADRAVVCFSVVTKNGCVAD